MKSYPCRGIWERHWYSTRDTSRDRVCYRCGHENPYLRADDKGEFVEVARAEHLQRVDPPPPPPLTGREAIRRRLFR